MKRERNILLAKDIGSCKLMKLVAVLVPIEDGHNKRVFVFEINNVNLVNSGRGNDQARALASVEIT